MVLQLEFSDFVTKIQEKEGKIFEPPAQTISGRSMHVYGNHYFSLFFKKNNMIYLVIY